MTSTAELKRSTRHDYHLWVKQSRMRKKANVILVALFVVQMNCTHSPASYSRESLDSICTAIRASIAVSFALPLVGRRWDVIGDLNRTII